MHKNRLSIPAAPADAPEVRVLFANRSTKGASDVVPVIEPGSGRCELPENVLSDLYEGRIALYYEDGDFVAAHVVEAERLNISEKLEAENGNEG